MLRGSRQLVTMKSGVSPACHEEVTIEELVPVEFELIAVPLIEIIEAIQAGCDAR